MELPVFIVFASFDLIRPTVVVVVFAEILHEFCKMNVVVSIMFFVFSV